MLREAIKEARANNDKVYMADNELWVAHGQGSGITSYLPDITKYLTNKGDDKNYDSNVDRLVKWSEVNKPLKTNKDKTVKLYTLPYYPHVDNEKYDVWGGDIKPIKNYYMVISTEGHAVVNIFDKKAEAMAWIRSV